MPDSLTAQWLDCIKQTMAVDLTRFQAAGIPPKAQVERLFGIPEVAQAFHLRANRKRPLAIDPGTDEERAEIVDALERVVAWLDDGFHERLVEQLREIAGVVAS